LRETPEAAKEMGLTPQQKQIGPSFAGRPLLCGRGPELVGVEIAFGISARGWNWRSTSNARQSRLEALHFRSRYERFLSQFYGFDFPGGDQFICFRLSAI
jgi:hypothetical protein